MVWLTPSAALSVIAQALLVLSARHPPPSVPSGCLQALTLFLSAGAGPESGCSPC